MKYRRFVLILLTVFMVACNSDKKDMNSKNQKQVATDAFNAADRAYRNEEFERAISLFDVAIVKGKDAKSKMGLAWILATCPMAELRDPDRAVTLAEDACKQSEWKNARALDTLAAACAGANDFANAIKHQTEAIKLADDDEMKESFQARLALYQSDKPYIETAND